MVTAIAADKRPAPAVLRLIAALAIISLAAALGLADVWHSLHLSWSTRYGPYEHGYLVLVMAIWVAVVEWRRAPVPVFSPEYIGLVPLALTVGALALMQLLYIDSTRLILIPPILLAALWAAFGRAVAHRLLWGVLFLYFALPQWWLINGALQEITVLAVSTFLRWTSIPAYIEGNQVLLPSGGFEIAAGCSGLNYLMAGTALVAFFALTRLGRWQHRIGLFAIGAAAAILFNWLRVYLVILVGYLSEMQHYLVRVEHHTLGWILFIAVYVPIVMYGMRLERREIEPAGPRAAGAFPERPQPFAVPATVVVASVLAALVLVSPLLPALASSDIAARAIIPLPQRIGGYARVSGAEPSWLPSIPGSDTELAHYESGAQTIIAFRGGFVAQDRDRRLVGGGSQLVGGAFRVESEVSRSFALAEGELRVTEWRGRDSLEQHVLVSWFEVGGFRARTRLGAKALELAARLAGRPDAWYVVVGTACSDSCDEAGAALERFVVEAAPEVRPEFRPLPPAP